MIKTLLLSSTLLLSGWTLAGNSSGQIGATLTIVRTCSVNTTGALPLIECVNSETFQPKVSRSKRVDNDRESEVITVEW